MQFRPTHHPRSHRAVELKPMQVRCPSCHSTISVDDTVFDHTRTVNAVAFAAKDRWFISGSSD